MLASPQTFCYLLIYYELRQFLHKLAEVPGRVRIPSLAPNLHGLDSLMLHSILWENEKNS